VDNLTPDHMKWFTDARFGMFIHWGLYAIPERGEWVMYLEDIPNDEYAKLADEFNPQHYDPREWVALAQDAGMKYMVLTTRHHDGFCLYDSQVSDFTAPKTACGRDLIAEYADACHEAGMPCGFYYSWEDWRFPGQLPHLPINEDMSIYEPMVEQAHAQVRELMTNYGKVDLLWYDGAFPGGVWRSDEVNAMARELQPGIIINNRSDSDGDFGTPEQHIKPQDGPWEACMTMNDLWGYAPDERRYKNVMQILTMLGSCAGQGGNLLLNVGPDAEGRIPQAAVDRLRAVGEWIRANGESIYGSTRTVLHPNNGMAVSTRVGDKLYLLVHAWPGSTVPLGWVGNKILSARMLETGQEATIEQNGRRVWLHDLPQHAPDPDMSVIEIEVEGEPRVPKVRFS
jgi:alpha-L-fucosidase